MGEEIKNEGSRMKLYRKLMGLKQIEMANTLDIHQANLSHLEAGRENAGWRYNKVRGMFESWRVNEIARLRKYIKYLKSL